MTTVYDKLKMQLQPKPEKATEFKKQAFEQQQIEKQAKLELDAQLQREFVKTAIFLGCHLEEAEQLFNSLIQKESEDSLSL